MDADKVQQMLIIHASYFPPESYSMLKEKLAECDQAKAMLVMSQLKDPTIALLLSIFLGHWGIDRFYIGSVGLGLGKLLTCGGAAIWWFIDCFLIMDATRQHNLQTALMLL